MQLQLGLSNFYTAAQLQLQNSTELETWQLQLPKFSRNSKFFQRASSCAAGKLPKKSIVQLLKFWYFAMRKNS
jgi:hypothetical protein